MKSSISHLWLRPGVCTSLLALVAAAAFSACTSEKAVPREDAGLSCTPELCAEQNLLCDSASGLCVECLAKADCADECKDCVDNVCQDIPGCNSPCLSGVTGEDGSCLNSQKVECTPVAADALPENAESVNAQVTITWTQEGGWTSPETCAWKCSDGFTKTADGAGCQPIQPVSCTRDEDCIDMGCDTGKAECALFKTVPCDADALPEHAVADKPTAEVAWDAVSGWEATPACEWTRCEADWHIMDEAVQTVCVYNTANMLCAGMDALPAHAVVDNPNVIVLWNEAANAWNEIPQCNWVACEEGFYKDGDQCARGESTTDCAGMDSVPSHADVLNPLVSIHYDSATGEWTKPEACRWKCIEGWHLDDKVCVTNDSYSLPCTGTVPENSVVTNPYIPQTWDEASQSWEPGSQGCTFACRKGFHFLNTRGICESDTREEACTGAENLPVHAVADNPLVTVHYENDTWTSPEACTWSTCEEGWHAENNACASNEKEVACHDAAPAHAVSIPANVVVTWNEEAGIWNAPADCAWDCLQNYHPADNGCAGDERDVECLGGTPANATSSNATIHQIYGDNGWEPAATNCDWKCNSGFHTEDGLNCVSNSTTRPCNDVAPAHATSVSVQVSVSWNEEEGRWNTPVNCSWRCDANYHRTQAGDACVGDEQDVECLGGTPANATSSNATIHQTYGDNGWEPAATNCDWQCNANFHTEDGRTCDPNTKLVDCIDAAPAHAQSENAQVPVQWNETEHKWETAQNCAWNCESSYHPENGGCVWTCAEGLVNDTNDGCIDCRNTADCDSATEYCDHNECVAWCGNGTADHGEACDWNDTSFDTSCPAWHSGSKSCSRSCAIVDNCAAPTVTCRSAPRNVTLGLNGSVTLETHFSVTAGDTVWTNAAWNPDNAPLSSIRLMVRTSGSGQWQALSGNYGAPADDGADVNSLRVTYAVTTADGLADGTYDAIWGFTMDGQDYWCPMDAAAQAAPVTDINSASAFISLNVSSDHCDNNSDCASGICEANGACATQQVVSCAAVTSGIPDHGHANPASNVTIYWNGTAWDPVPSCGWSCDDTFHLDGSLCVSNSRSVDCTGRENLPAHAVITNASVAQTWNGSAWTPSDTACVWNGCEADWHVENEDCVSNSKQVACRDAAPANAAPVNALVTVTWNANAGAWNQTPACAWNCVSSFHTEDDATCISNTRQELCTDPQIAHATTTHANVTVTWTAGSGWSAPAECAWSCNANYHPVGKSCAGDEQDVPCTGTIPEHATASNENIHQIYGDNGWAPAVENCRWTCDGGFHEEHSACVSDDDTAPCTDAAPANAISTIVNVAIHWNGNAWSTPADCEWSCISGFHTEDGATCVSNSKEVACTSAAPDNASSINALVTVTWTEGSGWSTAANCEWNCNAGFHTENQTTCISDDATAPCHNAAPENATSVSANVPIHWNGNAWSDPADCAWNCNPDFHRVNDACVSNTDSVPCIDNHPIHSQPVLTNVTVTWNTTTSSWNPTPECAWNCDANYHKNQTGDACVGNERDVPCIGTIPEHATASNENIHQIYGDNGWEPEAEACDWDCVSGFHTEDDATCISNTKEVACHNAAPENATSVNANVTVTWTQANGWSTPANCAWNCNSGYFPSGDSCVAYCGDGQINNGELCDYNNGHPIYAAAANCPDFYHDNRGCTESCQLSGSCDAPKQWCRIVGGTDEAGLRIGRDDGTKDTSYAQFYIEGLTDKGHAPDSEQFKAELFVKIGQGGDEGWFKLGSEFNKIADRNNAEMKADVSFELLRNAGADPDYIIENSPFSYVWRYQFGQEEKWHYCTIAASEHDQTPTDLSKVTPDAKVTVDFCIVNQCGSGEFAGKYCEPTKNDGRGEWIGCDSGVCYDAPNGKPSCLACNETQGCAEDEHCIVKENPLNNYCESNLRTEACTCSAPANGHCTETTFEQTWNGSAWNPPSHQCAWDCNTNYHPSGNGCAPDTRTQNCNNKPTNSHYTGATTFTQTWNGSIWYPETSSCDWACDSNYHKEGNSCVYNTRNTQYCTCPSIPEHGQCISETFEQNWNGSGWYPSSQTCGWTCTDGTFRMENQCGTCADVVLDKGYNWNSSNPDEVWQAILKGSEVCNEANLGKACDFEAGRCVPCTSDYGCEDKQYCRLDPENPEKNKCEQSCIQGVLDITHLTPNISEWKPEDWEAAHAASLTVCEGLGFAGRVCDMTYGGCVPCTENYGCKDTQACALHPASPDLNECVDSCTILTLNKAKLKLPLENQEQLELFNNTGVSVCVETLGHKDTVCDLASGLCVPCTDGFGCKDDNVCLVNEEYPTLNECGKGCESDDQCSKDSNGKLPYCDKESGTCEPCQTGYHWDDKKEACVADKQDEKCDCSAPDYAHCTENTFQQIWNHQIEQWLPTSHQCAWDCNTNYHPSGSGCAPDTRPQACNNKPANSHYTGATTFTQTWNGSSWAPATASFSQCPWACDTNYNQSGDTCVAATQTIACNNTKPEHSHYIDPGTFTQTWNGTIWDPATSSCTWECDTHYTKSGEQCVADTQIIACNNSIPQHSHYTSPGTFTQTWNGSAWAPATSSCDWACDTHYHPSNGSCAPDTRNTQYCTCPGGIPDDEICIHKTFEQTWNGSGWSPSSKTCDTGACASGYHPNATNDGCEPDSCFDLTIQKTGLSLPSSHWNTQQWNLFNEGGKVVCKALELPGTVCDPDSGLCVPCTADYGCQEKQYCNVDPENPEKNKCEDSCIQPVLEMAQLSPPTSNWTDDQWSKVRQKALEYCYSHGHEGMVCDFEYGGCVPCTEDYGCDEKQYCNIDSANPEKNHCEESCVSTVLDKAHLSLPTSNWNPDDWAKAHMEALAYCKDAGHEGMVCDFEYGGCVPCTTDYGCDDSTYCHLDPVNPEQNYCEKSCTSTVISEAGLSQKPISDWTPDDWDKAKLVALEYCNGLGYKGMVCDFEYGGCVPCTTDYGCNKYEYYCQIDPEIPQNNQCEQSCIQSVLDMTGLHLPISKWDESMWNTANAAGVSVCEDEFKQPGTVCDFEYGGCVPCTENYGCQKEETCFISPAAPENNECITSCTELTLTKAGLKLPLENEEQWNRFNDFGRTVCSEDLKQENTVCDLNSGLCVPCVDGFGCKDEKVCIINEAYPTLNECGKPCESDGQCNEDTHGALPFCIKGICERCQDGEHWDEGVGKCINDIKYSDCTCDHPSNAQCTETSFQQTWNHQIEQWMPLSHMCAWKCDTNYHESGNSCEPDTKDNVPCNNKPANSYYTGATTFTQTWNGSSWVPATASFSQCPWECNAGYYQSGNSCVLNGGGGGSGGGGETGECPVGKGGGSGPEGCAQAGEKAVNRGEEIWSMPEEYLEYSVAHEAANKWCFEQDLDNPICHVWPDGTSQCVACDELYSSCCNGYKCEVHPESPQENRCVETCRLATLGKEASVYNQDPTLVAEANALGQEWCDKYESGSVCDFDSGECVKCTATAGCDVNNQHCAIQPQNPQENRCVDKQNCYWALMEKYGECESEDPKYEYDTLAEYGFWWNDYTEPVTQFSDVLDTLEKCSDGKHNEDICSSDEYCDYPTGQCFPTCTETEGCPDGQYCIYTDDTHQDRKCEPLKSDTACSMDGRLWWDGYDWTTCLGKCGPSFDKPEEFACGQSCSAYAWNNSYYPYGEFYERFAAILDSGDADGWGRLTHLYSLGNAYCQKVLPEGSEATVCDMFTGQCVPPPVKE